MPAAQGTHVPKLASFEALTETSKKVNSATKRLSESVEKLNDALKKLNLGIPVWIEVCGGSPDDHIVETEEIGYAKFKGKWGICIRFTVEGLGPDPEETIWHFDSAPREMRIHAADYFGKLLLALNDESLKQAQIMEERATNIDELTSSVIDIANRAHGRVSLRPSKMEAE
jgi:hypothetical protein